MQHIPQPQRIADVHGFVETVVPLHLLDGFLGDFCTTYAAPAGSAFTHLSHLETQNLPLDRTARHKVHDYEDSQRDTKEGRNDQKKTAYKVTSHFLAACFSCSVLPNI